MADALARHLEDPREYAAEYPVPTVALSEPLCEPGSMQGSLVFRGPTWIHTNWYIARGLRRHGRGALADRIVQSSIALTAKSGFREYYHPQTAEGYGAQGFSWSALVLDMLAAD